MILEAIYNAARKRAKSCHRLQCAQSAHEIDLGPTTFAARFRSHKRRISSVKKPGSKKSVKSASIYDVAREARVSVFTVSAVVNHKSHVREKLRKRVESAIRALNYRPNLIARSLANQRTHTIGMIVPDIANPFFPVVVRGAEDAAQRHGYNLLLCNSDDSLEKEEAAVELLLANVWTVSC